MALVVQLFVATVMHPDFGTCSQMMREQLRESIRNICYPNPKAMPKSIRAALGTTCSDPVKLEAFVDDFVAAMCSAQPQFSGQSAEITYDPTCVGVRWSSGASSASSAGPSQSASTASRQTVREVVSAMLDLMKSGVAFVCAISAADRAAFVRSMLGIDDGASSTEGPKDATDLMGMLNGPNGPTGLSKFTGLKFQDSVQPGQCRVVCSQLVTQMLNENESTIRRAKDLPIVQSTIRKIADAVAAQVCAESTGLVDGKRLAELVVATAVGVFDAMCAFASNANMGLFFETLSTSFDSVPSAVPIGTIGAIEPQGPIGPLGSPGPLGSSAPLGSTGPIGPLVPQATTAPSTLVPTTTK